MTYRGDRLPITYLWSYLTDFDIVSQQKLFISNLPKFTTEAEVDVRRAELERAFGLLLEGLVYGIEIGALWLVVLGNASDPSFM